MNVSMSVMLFPHDDVVSCHDPGTSPTELAVPIQDLDVSLFAVSAPRFPADTVSTYFWRIRRAGCVSGVICANAYATTYAGRPAQSTASNHAPPLGRTRVVTPALAKGIDDYMCVSTTDGAVDGDSVGGPSGPTNHAFVPVNQSRLLGGTTAAYDNWTPTEAVCTVLGHAKRIDTDRVRGIPCCLTDSKTIGRLAGDQHAALHSCAYALNVDRWCTAFQNAPLGGGYAASCALQMRYAHASEQCEIECFTQRAADG